MDKTHVTLSAKPSRTICDDSKSQSDIIFTCIKSGFSKGTFDDDGTPYQLSMEVKPNQNPTLAPACEIDLKIRVEKDALWEMRGWMCAAGGCEGWLDNRELFSAADNCRLHITGNPLDQTTTQFSQTCYDATICSALGDRPRPAGKAGGTIDAGGDQSYGFVVGEGNLSAFQRQDLEDLNGNDGC
ncbi:hypothetical protein G7Y79_00046g082730 [Physcia stellaris]|nr:hypothetical protein G7Y79_00046g082730 [Physcia stellaris]